MVCVCLANFVQHGRFFLFSPFLPKIKLHSKLLGSKHSHYFFPKYGCGQVWYINQSSAWEKHMYVKH